MRHITRYLLLQIWRSKPKFGGLCIFPQASTGSSNTVHSFMPRTFEVLTDQEDVHPVIADYTPMMPINLRTACSGFFADMFWLGVMPMTYVRFTVLPAVPKGLTPEQAAAHCQAEIARYAEVPRQELDVNCFDKRHWRKTVEAGLHPRWLHNIISLHDIISAFNKLIIIKYNL